MISSKNNKENSPYYIFVNGGERMYLLGSDGQYLEENTSCAAMTFDDIIDATTYVEKHGLQRLATIRKAKQTN